MALVCTPAPILGTACFPELARVSDSIPDLRRILRSSWRLLLGLGTLASVGMFTFAEFAVTLIFGRGQFDPAVAILQTFAPILPIFFVDILLGYAITALGKAKEMAVIKFLTVVLSTALAILLIPICQDRFGNGGIGLALAFGSTELLMLIAFIWLLPRGVMNIGAFFDFLRAAAAAAGTMATLWALPSMSAWLGIPLCVAVFTALALATGLIRKAELGAIADLGFSSKPAKEARAEQL